MPASVVASVRGTSRGTAVSPAAHVTRATPASRVYPREHPVSRAPAYPAALSARRPHQHRCCTSRYPANPTTLVSP
eukprot:CAMPEP_0172191288 /NCGR_PEP_ID=MMETSP1050-20130122/23615_1 /TAXON_ID=233186 /ORGANISM="Cryptomonas curvata, Strain CCAP979/52" /LENGTH=75 /DNA_ID=CAMNT_0012866315 /DNA_START=320 /DNA_END=543 /DNA_ORIENTATION=-